MSAAADPAAVGDGARGWFTRRVEVPSTGPGDQFGPAHTPADGDALARHCFAPAGNLSHFRPHRPAELAAARHAVAVQIDAPVATWHFMRQVHGARVAVVDESTPAGQLLDDVDAIVTRVPHRPLVATVADCVPVLFAGQTAVAVAHAGRQGIVAGVIDATLAALTAYEDLDMVRVVVGPSIGPCCYEVPADLREQVASRFPVAYSTTSWDTPSVDLAATVEAEVRRVGVRHVAINGGCTHCDPHQRWFSHRRDPATGRFAGIVVKQP